MPGKRCGGSRPGGATLRNPCRGSGGTPAALAPPRSRRTMSWLLAKEGTTMMRRNISWALLLLVGACSDGNTTRSDVRVHELNDSDGDGLMEEEGGGGVIM